VSSAEEHSTVTRRGRLVFLAMAVVVALAGLYWSMPRTDEVGPGAGAGSQTPEGYGETETAGGAAPRGGGDGAGGAAEEAAAERDPRWGVPMELPGVGNFHKINDNLYRGEQPTARGMRELRKLGIKTIVNLRSLHSDRDEIGDLDLDYVRIRFEPWNAERDEIAEFLAVATDPERQPVFFHCQHGADRTGTMAAVYRIAIEGWSKEDAIEEMKKGGYGFHKIWVNLPRYIRWLDIDEIRKMAGLGDRDDAEEKRDE